jgi:hypothetical protein
MANFVGGAWDVSSVINCRGANTRHYTAKEAV